MKTYWVVWTYIANYRVTQVQAKTPEEAHEIATFIYSRDFHEKADVFVFDRPPALVVRKGETSHPAEET